MTLSDFEQQLKQHQPQQSSTDIAELFYQCGWNARASADLPAVIQWPTPADADFFAGVSVWPRSVGRPVFVEPNRQHQSSAGGRSTGNSG